jgi:acyl-CoA synthetase (AMP-forming)/AMP-acid ligase II
VDDVVNVSGHRIGTAELETALISHDSCNEAAVIAVPHEMKGQVTARWLGELGRSLTLSFSLPLSLSVSLSSGGLVFLCAATGFRSHLRSEHRIEVDDS